MNKTQHSDIRLFVLSIVLSGGIFAVDLALPLGVAGGVPYMVVVLASLWSPRRRATYLAAGTGTTLTALGYVLSAPGGIFWMVLANRFLALFVVWAAALLVLQRKNAEKALCAGEERYRNLFDQAPISLWEEDFSALEKWFSELRETGVGDLSEYLEQHPEAVQEAARLIRVVDVNEGALRLFGVRSMAELSSTPLKDVEEHRGSAFSNRAFVEQLIAIWTGQRRFETEFAASTPEGAEIDCLLQWVTPQAAGKLDLSCVIIAISDITERKRAEEERRLSAEIAEHVAEGINLVRISDGAIVYTNDRFNEIFGYGPRELVGRHVSVLNAAGEKNPEETVAEIIGCVQTNGGWHGELLNVKKNGTQFWCRAHVSTFEHSEHGTVWLTVQEDITERKQAEQAIREKEKQLDNLLSNVGVIVLEGDPFEIDYVGGQVERILGYPKEQWFEDPEGPVGFWSKHLHSDDRDKIELCRRAIEGGRDHEFEYRMIAADGREVWFYDTVTVETENGRPIKTRSVMVDITERMRAEETLRESEARYHSLARLSPVGIFRADQAGNYTYVNEEWCRIAGTSSDDAVGDGWARPLHPDDRESVFNEWQTAAKNQRRFTAEYRFQRPDGATTWVLGQAESETDAMGNVTGYVGTITDITERMQAESALRDSEERLRQIAETVDDVFWITDWESKGTLFASRAYERVWGRSLQHLYADPRNWANAIHPEHRGDVWERFEQLGEGYSFDEEYKIAQPDGSIRWIRDRGFPIRDESGRVYRAVGIAQDITERKHAERALRKSEQRLQSILDGVFAFVGLYTIDGVLIEANRAPLEAANLKREDVIGKPFWETYWWSYSAEVQQQLRDALACAARGETIRYDVPVRVAEDEFMTIDVMFGPLYDEAGEVSQLIGSAVDITDRKRAEEALQESERRLRSVLGGLYEAPVGLCFLDRELKYVYVNQWLAELNGTSVEDHLGRTIREVLPNISAGAEAQLRQVMETGEPVIDGTVEVEIAAAPVRKHVFQHNYYPVAGDDGSVVGVSCAIQDITRRRRAEAERARLTTAIEELVEAVVITDADGMVEYVNSAFERMTGYSPSETIGQNLRLLKSGRHDQAFYEEFWGTIKSGDVWTGTFINKRKDGTIYEEEESISPVHDESGKITNYVAVKHDVTDRRRAEEALRASEARYQDLYNNAPDMFCSVDSATEAIVECNQTLAAATGYSKTELIGRQISELYHPDCETDRLEVFKKFTALGEVRDAELQLHRKDGQHIDVSLSVSAVRDEQGSIVRSRSIWRDITRRRHAEQALLESEERFRRAVVDAPVPIMIHAEDGEVLRINRVWTDLTGYHPEEIPTIGEWTERAYGACQEAVKERIDQLYQIDGRVAEGEYTITTKDGRTVIWDFSSSPLGRTDDGRRLVISMAADVTEKRQAEARIRQQQDELAHLARVSTMAEMATGFAHELNQPLASIVNFAEGCQQRITSGTLEAEGLRSALADISSEARRAGEVIRRLRQFVRNKESNHTRVEVRQLCEGSLALLRHELQAGDIRTHFEIEDPLPDVLGDSIQLQQVVLNLAQNSLEAMAETPTQRREITISAAVQEDHRVTIAVRDNGSGLAEADRNRILEPFYTTKPKGTGMGLAISRTIVEAHGGQLRATDNAAGGCTFQFSLSQHPEA